MLKFAEIILFFVKIINLTYLCMQVGVSDSGTYKDNIVKFNILIVSIKW